MFVSKAVLGVARGTASGFSSTFSSAKAMTHSPLSTSIGDRCRFQRRSPHLLINTVSSADTHLLQSNGILNSRAFTHTTTASLGRWSPTRGRSTTFRVQGCLRRDMARGA